MSRTWPSCALLMISMGCDGRVDSIRPPIEGGVLTFDAAMIPQPDGGVLADDGGTGEDAGSDPALDRRLFVPDIPLTYSGTLTDPGIELLAWTIREDPVLRTTQFLLAIRNTYGSPLCGALIFATFRDAAGIEVADADEIAEGPPHRGVSGTGRLTPGCLSDGDVGMMAAGLFLRSGRNIGEIASGTYTVSAINLIDAVPTDDIVVTGVTTAPGTFGGNHFVGRVENRSTSGTFRNPSVSIFGLNAVGRPLFESGDIELLDIPRGGSWSFSTTPNFDETFASFVAFPDANEP